MGRRGCKVEPHLRPHCTCFTCNIHTHRTDPDAEWTQAYFDLREQIDMIEWRS